MEEVYVPGQGLVRKTEEADPPTPTLVSFADEQVENTSLPQPVEQAEHASEMPSASGEEAASSEDALEEAIANSSGISRPAKVAFIIAFIVTIALGAGAGYVFGTSSKALDEQAEPSPIVAEPADPEIDEGNEAASLEGTSMTEEVEG